MAFIDWAQNIFANLGDYIGNVISNAASSAWNSAKSFIGLGDDEEQSLPAYSGGAGMNGIPYGAPGINDSLGMGGGTAYSSSYSSNQNIYLTAPDAVASADAVADRSQQQQREAQRMFSRNGL
ncbi:hypothetical protein ACIJH7_004348 [Yersinia enterocolitica]|nr:hypothetical protein [Yersinia enterocolitica]